MNLSNQLRAEQTKNQQLTALLSRHPKLFNNINGTYRSTELAQRSQKAMPAYHGDQQIGFLIPAKMKLPTDDCFTISRSSVTSNIIARAKTQVKSLNGPTIIIVEPETAANQAVVSFLPTAEVTGSTKRKTVYLLSEGYSQLGRLHARAMAYQALEVAEEAYQAQFLEQNNLANGVTDQDIDGVTYDDDTV
jgi:hypothetical protein